MACLLDAKERANLLLDYCERRLSVAVAAEFERHLAVCEDCAAMVAAQREVWEALEAWEAEPVSPSFDARLYNQLERMDAEPWWQRWVPGSGRKPWKPAMPLAAACLAVLAVALLRTPAAPEPPGGAGEETIDVEQVETVLNDLEMLEQLGLTKAGKGGGERL
jgi:anti-sigma factor RsiW